MFSPLFPNGSRFETPVTHVTKGVHVPVWDSMEADKLWTNLSGKLRWCSGQANLSEQFSRATDEALWNLRAKNRNRLVKFVRDVYARELNIQTNIPETQDNQYLFSLQVYLGELSPDEVSVELFADTPEDDSFSIQSMQIEQALAGAVNGFVSARGSAHF